jgi:TRAP-type C4-dicarboxylate transport system permease small subunit
MKVLHAIDSALVRVETVLLVAFLGVMVVLSFAQVVLRNVFGTGLLWADPLVRHLVLWAGFMGAAMATSSDRHISIDAFNKFLPERGRQVVHALTSLFAAATCWFLAQAAWTFIQDEYAAGGEIALAIPSWVALLILPAGYFLLTLHFLLRVPNHVARALRGSSGGDS